jgi:ATP-dependent DNA helicase RecG
MLRLDASLRELKGIGKIRASDLAKAGLLTLEDLLKYAPTRYEDRIHCARLADLMEERPVLFRARVTRVRFYRDWRRRMPILQVEVCDDSGPARLVFYNQSYLAKTFIPDSEFFIYSSPKLPSKKGVPPVFFQPDYERIDPQPEEPIHMGRLVPVYRRAGSCSSRLLRTFIYRVQQKGIDWPAEILPQAVIERHELMARPRALTALHFPETALSGGETAAAADRQRAEVLRRLKFEEMFHFHLGLLERKSLLLASPKVRPIDQSLEAEKLASRYLNFPLTGAQKRVTGEIFSELAASRPMCRLLQGDVGSGKTAVALLAALAVISSGGQVALMTPTEVLAEQHFLSFRRWLDPAGFRVVCLTGSLPASERKTIAEGLESGRIHMVVGTHALIQESTRFKTLALAIVDEQHRFGVWQRLQLAAKGSQPDILAMTATPIPRTLTLTLYGDLDVSVLDELPPGRQPVRTVHAGESRRDDVHRAMRREVQQGRQVYYVCPVIDASERPSIRDVLRAYDHFRREVFPDCAVGLLHGRLAAEEKLRVLSEFSSGRIGILVCTTVIEVGVDVPNATLMVIQNADRFGLAQLHQLRGRVGRGDHPGRCLLVTAEDAGPEAIERMRLLCGTSDGFKIAEMDLERRGPGEIGGLRQSGLPEFRFVDLIHDRELIETARDEARGFFQRQRCATDPETECVMAHARKIWSAAADLIPAG